MGAILVATVAITLVLYLFLVFLIQRIVRRRAPAWVHRVFIVTALCVIPALVGVEVHVRARYWRQYRELATAAIFKNEEMGWSELDDLAGRTRPADDPGPFKANGEFHTWWVPVLTKEIALHRVARTNNLGLLSDRTYHIAKKPGEFRIVFLGDSMTGTTTMNKQWVDDVEDLLNADPDLEGLGRTFKTYNIGWPGAGFPKFVKEFEEYGAKLGPDLVVVNFIESDFPRFDFDANPIVTKEKIGGGFVEMEVPDASQSVYLNVIGKAGELSLFNAECYQFYVYYADPSVVEDDEARRYLIDKTRRDYSIGKAFLTLYPYSIHHFRGEDVGFYNYRHPEWFHIPEVDEERMLVQAKACVERIAKQAPRTILTLMPLWNDAYPTMVDYGRTKRFQSMIQPLRIEVMRERLPFATTSAEDAKSWYNLPWDGHMSEEGGRLYARAMVDHLRPEIIASSSGSGGR